MAKTRKFSVRLLKEGKTFDSACKDIDSLTLVSQDEIYSVYLVSEAISTPWWKDYLEIRESLTNKSNSAILTVKASERTLVYTFGFAHTKLNMDCFEENFGFLVTINSIDGEKLKSIDAYSPASNTKQKRVVSSILSNIYEYDFNDSQDLVQKLSGVIKNEYKDLFTNPTGTDSLSMHSKSSKSELVDISKKLIERFNSNDYTRDTYLKNINKIKKANSVKREELNSVLLAKLNEHNVNDIYMADYEILDLEQFYGYKFNNEIFPNLSIENIHLENDLTLEKLKSLKISILRTEDDHHPIQWSLYKCLVFDYNNTFLSKGDVYEVQQDFLAEVDNFLVDYKIENFLPNACPNEKEGEYNNRIKNQHSLFLLDKKCPNIEGYSKVEICDIYNKTDNQFIHIKRSDSSSSLSHLWSQGVVSEQLANSGNLKFKEKFIEETGEEFPEDHVICYGIIKKTEHLPIFSRISLYNSIKILKGMGKRDDDIKYFYINISKIDRNE